MQEITCCFLGHREINETDELIQNLYSVIENLIVDKKVDTFLFGSKSRFDKVCHQQVTKIKEKYPHIKRIYVRAEFPEIDENYNAYLLEQYEKTYYPPNIKGSGKAAYVERNQEMIDKSHFCVIYFQEGYSPRNRKSGTKLALNYAIKKKKTVIVFP